MIARFDDYLNVSAFAQDEIQVERGQNAISSSTAAPHCAAGPHNTNIDILKEIGESPWVPAHYGMRNGKRQWIPGHFLRR